jgi:lipid-binding SYLF domain-containing protein
MKKNGMRILNSLAIAILCMGLASCATTQLSPSDKAEKQDSLRNMANQALTNLYNNNPAAQGAVMNAAGYAVFSDFGFKLIYAGGAKGKGIAVNNATRQETFMKMMELQPGYGLGADKFWLIFVFETPDAFNTFVNAGWEAGANLMMAAKSKIAGGALAGAVTVSDGVYMYQITQEGLIVGVSITGAKYSRDEDLN